MSRLLTYGIIHQKRKLLLDIYPSASVAYSFRKLRSTYTGYCINVYRSSDGANSDIGFVRNYLDETALLSFIGSGNGYVRIIYDQSGNNRNSLPLTIGESPRIVNSGTIDKNDNFINMVFDGSNDYINSNYNQPANIFVFFAGTRTTNNDFGVVNNAALQVGRLCLSGWGFLSRTVVGGVATWPGPTGYFTSNLSDLSENTKFLSTGSWDNTNKIVKYKRNGTSATSPGTTGSSLRNTNSGPLYFFPGNMFELILYNTDKSSDSSGIEANINNFYSIY